MIGAGLILLGAFAGISGWVLLRRSGTAWRVGRILASAPTRTIGEIVAGTARGEVGYVRVHGRIDSDEEFTDHEGKPIVYRRRRLQQRAHGSWQTFEDDRQAVPFRLQEAGERVAIDIEALGDGLVVVPREAQGVAADLSEGALGGPLPDLPAETPVRLRVEQVSSVEHATAAGVPRLEPDGSVVLGPGQGRPLVLTTLELDEAMRILGADRRPALLAAAALIASVPVLLVIGVVLLVLGL